MVHVLVFKSSTRCGVWLPRDVIRLLDGYEDGWVDVECVSMVGKLRLVVHCF